LGEEKFMGEIAEVSKIGNLEFLIEFLKSEKK
jgi:hypothetical protein